MPLDNRTYISAGLFTGVGVVLFIARRKGFQHGTLAGSSAAA
jgi:hypothetical protein